MAVHEYGRLVFLVDSHSRDKMFHLVDFEPELDDEGKPDPLGEPYKCSCEAFNLRCMRPCRHCIEVFEYLLPIVQHLSHWQPVQKCPRCGSRMKGGICQNYGCESPRQKPREYKIKHHP